MRSQGDTLEIIVDHLPFSLRVFVHNYVGGKSPLKAGFHICQGVTVCLMSHMAAMESLSRQMASKASLS